MKYAGHILKYGRIKPFFDKTYRFNTLDVETVHNEIFMIGYTLDGRHVTHDRNFYDGFHRFLIENARRKSDILTWTRYDNTHVLKLILKGTTKDERDRAIARIGKVSPIHEYSYGSLTFRIENVIKDSIIFRIIDHNESERTVILYNLKNLYTDDLLTTAQDYGIDYYSKLDASYHVIDPKRYETEPSYRAGVIESNRLDNAVLKDIAHRMLTDFKRISGNVPKSIFTCGSLARSYLLSRYGTKGASKLNFRSIYNRHPLYDLILDYTMRSYHGGKIESYVIGYIERAKVIDITAAYPYAMSGLPELDGTAYYGNDRTRLNDFFYAFIKCDIRIDDPKLIHPVIVENPINRSNVSPYGHLRATITKPEYDYLIRKGVTINVIDFIGLGHRENYPYKDLVQDLFDSRMATKKKNPSLSAMYKIIINSLYGIHYELTDLYIEKDDTIVWAGYRAGDYFNPVIASYITALTRTYLSDVSDDIRLNGGRVYLNMTDSIFYNGHTDMDVFSTSKTLGKFEPPKLVKDVFILGAGRYEYMDEFDQNYTIKNRGFSVKVKDQSFYSKLDLNQRKVKIAHRTFVTSFKASTKRYGFDKMGHLIDDTYEINPFNLGGKRIVIDPDIDLNRGYTETKPVYLERGVL